MFICFDGRPSQDMVLLQVWHTNDCRIGVKNTSTEKIWFPCHYLVEMLTAGVP